MGCDIHGFVQRKIKENEWLDICEIAIGRNYPTFGILAGVRNYSYDPISCNRGAPEGVEIIDDEYELNNYKNFKFDKYSTPKPKLSMGEGNTGYAGFDEILEREADFIEAEATYVLEWIKQVLEEQSVKLDDLEEIKKFRMVFGFDSV